MSVRRNHGAVHGQRAPETYGSIAVSPQEEVYGIVSILCLPAQKTRITGAIDWPSSSLGAVLSDTAVGQAAKENY